MNRRVGAALLSLLLWGSAFAENRDSSVSLTTEVPEDLPSAASETERAARNISEYCTFNGRCRPDIHKYRSLYHAMYGMKLSTLCLSVFL